MGKNQLGNRILAGAELTGGYLLVPCPDTSFLFSRPRIVASRKGALLCTGTSSSKER